MGALFSGILQQSAPTPTQHQSGWYHNLELRSSSIKELRCLRTRVAETLQARRANDELSITAELAPLDAEIRRRELAPGPVQ